MLKFSKDAGVTKKAREYPENRAPNADDLLPRGALASGAGSFSLIDQGGVIGGPLGGKDARGSRLKIGE